MVLNFYGGPGIGKSTKASELFFRCKQQNLQVELIHEFAKDMVYSQSMEILKDQYYVGANQHHRVWRVHNYYLQQGFKEDEFLIITDSPILLGAAYTDDDKLRDFIFETSERYNNINIMLTRKFNYQEEGRNQDLKGAIEIDKKVLDLLNKTSYIETNDTDKILSLIKEKMSTI